MAAKFTEEVELQGHIIDSLLLPKVLDEILTRGGSYVIKDIASARGRPTPASPASKCGPTSAAVLEDILDAIHDHGAVPVNVGDCQPVSRPTWTGPFPRASTAPPTIARRSASAATGSRSNDQEMDCGILVDLEGARPPAACR